MDCPQCGKRMVRWGTGVVLLSYPPQYPWNWRCGCGHREFGGVERGTTEDEQFMAAWHDANAEEQPR